MLVYMKKIGDYISVFFLFSSIRYVYFFYLYYYLIYLFNHVRVFCV